MDNATTTVKIRTYQSAQGPRGKRVHFVECGMLIASGNTAAEAKAAFSALVNLSLTHREAIGGETTGRLYVLEPQGAAGASITWGITILNPAKGNYPRGGGMGFTATPERAREMLREYRDSCEQAAAPAA